MTARAPVTRSQKDVVRRVVDKPVCIGIVSGLLGLLMVVTFSVASTHGVGALVHAAPPITDASAPRSLPVLTTNRGFDGQYYYRMAVSPFSTDPRVAGVRFDLPALRQQRVGYSVVAWIASLGDRDLAPAALALTNVAGLFALGWIGGLLARTFGRSAAWGLLFVLFPGFVYSIGFDLSEIVATAFVAAAVLALLRDHPGVAALLGSCAVVTRETTAILPIALVVAAAWTFLSAPGRDERRAATREAVAGVVPLFVLAAWQLWLRSQWHVLPLDSSAGKNVRFPFQGLVDAIDKFLPPSSGAALFRDVSLAFLVLVTVVGALSLRRSAAPRFVKVGFVLGAVVVALLSPFPWSGATSFVRAGSELFFYAALLVVAHEYRARVQGLLTYSTIGLFALTFASEVAKARP